MIKFDCGSLSDESTSDTNWVKYSISFKLKRRIIINEVRSARIPRVNVFGPLKVVNERIEEDIFMFAYDWRKINFPGKRLDTSLVFTRVYGDARSSLVTCMHKMFIWYRKDISFFSWLKKKKPIPVYYSPQLSPVNSLQGLNARIETILINKFITGM